MLYKYNIQVLQTSMLNGSNPYLHHYICKRFMGNKEFIRAFKGQLLLITLRQAVYWMPKFSDDYGKVCCKYSICINQQNGA